MISLSRTWSTTTMASASSLQQWRLFSNSSLPNTLNVDVFLISPFLSDLINSNYAVQKIFLRSRKTTSCICTSQILDFDWNLTKWPVMPETNQKRSKLYLRWNKGMPFQFAYWYKIFCPFRPNKNIDISVSYSVKEKVNLF